MKYLIDLNRFIVVILLISGVVSCSSNTENVTLEDYQRAEKFLSANTSSLVYGQVSGQTWQSDDQLIYKNTIPEGSEYILANPSTGSKFRAFDHEKLAQSISEFSEEEYLPFSLSLSQIKLNEDDGQG